MNFLLDTNVVSELRKPERRANARVLAWARAQPLHALHLSVISVMEIEIGVARIERRDRHQGELLRAWLDDRVLGAFHSRILAVDLRVVRRAAMFHVPDPRPERDALFAATALTNDMAVVTRNESDFVALGVEVRNPWTDG